MRKPRDLALSGDGSTIVVTLSDGGVFAKNFVTNKSNTHKKINATSIALTNNGKKAFISYKRYVKVYDRLFNTTLAHKYSKQLGWWGDKYPQESTAVFHTVRLSNDEKYLYAACQYGIVIWNIKKNTQSYIKMKVKGYLKFTLSVDDHYLYASDDSKVLNIYDIDNQAKPTFVRNFDFGLKPKSIDISGDGDFLIVLHNLKTVTKKVGTKKEKKKYNATLLHIGSGNKIEIFLQAHVGLVPRALTIGSDNKYVYIVRKRGMSIAATGAIPHKKEKVDDHTHGERVTKTLKDAKGKKDDAQKN